MDFMHCPPEIDPTKPHRFLRSFDLREFGRHHGDPFESVQIVTFEAGDRFTNDQTHTPEGGVLIPLYGKFAVETGDLDIGEVPIDLTTAEGIFTAFFLRREDEVLIKNIGKHEGRVLCLSTSTFCLLAGNVRGLHLNQHELIHRFHERPTWIYVNTMTEKLHPAGNHYHTRTRELLVPVHGTFDVHLVDVASKQQQRHILFADADDPRDHELFVQPGTAHAVVKRGKAAFARLLVISTSRPRSDDDVPYMVIPSP